jgi:hypothetical protein
VSREVAVAEQDTDLDDMNPLQRLIVERMRQRGWTPKEIEARGIRHATLHRYTNPLALKTPPRPATIRQLAEALDLDYDRVWRAAVDAVVWSQRSRTREPATPEGDAAVTTERLEMTLAAVEREHEELRRKIEALKKELTIEAQ